MIISIPQHDGLPIKNDHLLSRRFLRYAGMVTLTIGFLGFILMYFSPTDFYSGFGDEIFIANFLLYIISGLFFIMSSKIQAGILPPLILGGITGYAIFTLLDSIVTVGLLLKLSIISLPLMLLHLPATLITWFSNVSSSETWNNLDDWALATYMFLFNSIPFIIIGALFGKARSDNKAPWLAYIVMGIFVIAGFLGLVYTFIINVMLSA